jgi:purine-binding chemotaxis protein CheW
MAMTMAETNAVTSRSVINEEEQFVTFMIADEMYGVPVLKVQEIIGMTRITAVPNSLLFMRGVIDLRGDIVPVIDMRLKFSMEESLYSNFTVIIIVEVKEQLVGMIVDSVSDVLSLPVSTIQDTPQFNTRINTSYISGMSRMDNSLIIVLDVDKILSVDELEQIDADSMIQ